MALIAAGAIWVVAQGRQDALDSGAVISAAGIVPANDIDQPVGEMSPPLTDLPSIGLSVPADADEAQKLVSEAASYAGTDPEKAEKLYAQAILKNPRSWTTYDSYGKLLLSQNLADDALDLAKSCLQVDEHAPYCHDLLIGAYELLGDQEAVVASIQLCRQARPDDSSCIQKERERREEISKFDEDDE